MKRVRLTHSGNMESNEEGQLNRVMLGFISLKHLMLSKQKLQCFDI